MQTQSVFQFNQSSNVRTFADEKGEYWFLANDVCSILGYSNPRDAISKHCKNKGVAKRDTPTQSGKQEMTYINEPNLYRLIIKSRKPEAAAFEEWVMEEVLPTIRKTGSYIINNKLTPAQKQQIREAVKARHYRTGEHWQEIYHKLHAYLKVNSYHEITVEQFQTALNFLASIENAPVVKQAKPIPNIKPMLTHALYCAEFILQHYDGLKVLNKKLAGNIHGHANDGIACIYTVADSLGFNLPKRGYFDNYPWSGDYEERRRYRQQLTA